MCQDEKEGPQNDDQGVALETFKKNIFGAPKWLWGTMNGLMGLQLDQTSRCSIYKGQNDDASPLISHWVSVTLKIVTMTFYCLYGFIITHTILPQKSTTLSS